MRPCKHGKWELCKVQSGTIHGLPSISGRLLATDGVIAIIELPNGKAVTAHKEFFEPFKEERVYEGKALTKQSKWEEFEV